MKFASACPLAMALVLAGCATAPPAVDPSIQSEVDSIPAIDNHAHPVRVTGAGEQPDRLFDALPVDHMEAQSDPVNRRPGSPAGAEASRALFGGTGRAARPEVMRQKGEQYPSLVRDRMG